MNWRRGLFRLWIVGTVLFVLAVAFVSYSEIKAQFDAVASKPKAIIHSSILAQFRQRYPQYNDLSDAQLADALYKKFYTDIPREQFDRKIAGPNTKIIEFQGRMHEFPADATDDDIAAALATEPVTFDDLIPAPNPWNTLGIWAIIALGIPLAVLALGASLVWAFSGFAAKRS